MNGVSLSMSRSRVFYLYTWDNMNTPQPPVYTAVANGRQEVFFFRNYLDVRKTMNYNHIIRFWFRHQAHQCGNILLEFSIGSDDDLRITIHDDSDESWGKCQS